MSAWSIPLHRVFLSDLLRIETPVNVRGRTVSIQLERPNRSKASGTAGAGNPARSVAAPNKPLRAAAYRRREDRHRTSGITYFNSGFPLGARCGSDVFF
jgi:hypothetical protein